MPSTIGAPRQLLRRLREVMAARESVQERLDKVVMLIAGNMVAEVSSLYLLQARRLARIVRNRRLEPGGSA